MEPGAIGNLLGRVHRQAAPTGAQGESKNSLPLGATPPTLVDPGLPRVVQAQTMAGTGQAQPTASFPAGRRLMPPVEDQPPPDRLPHLRQPEHKQGWVSWLGSFVSARPTPRPAPSILEDNKGWNIDEDPPLDRDPLQIIGAYVATPELIDLMTQGSGVPADRVDLDLVDTKAVLSAPTLGEFAQQSPSGPCWVQIGPYLLTGDDPVYISAVYLETIVKPGEPGDESNGDVSRTVYFRIHEAPEGLKGRGDLMIKPAPDGHGYLLWIKPEDAPELHVKQCSAVARPLSREGIVALPMGARVLIASYSELLPAIVLQTEGLGGQVMLSVRAPWAPVHHQSTLAEGPADRKAGRGHLMYAPVGSTEDIEDSLRRDNKLVTVGDLVPQAGQFPLGRGPQYEEIVWSLGSAQWYEFSISIDPDFTSVQRDPFFDQTRERPLPPPEALPAGAGSIPVYEDGPTDLYAEFGLSGNKPSALAELFSRIPPGARLTFGDTEATFVQMAHSEDAPEAMWLRAPAHQLNDWSVRAVPAPHSSQDWLYLVPLPVPVTAEQCVALQLKAGHPMVVAEPVESGRSSHVYSASLRSTSGTGNAGLDITDSLIGEIETRTPRAWAFVPRGLYGATPSSPSKKNFVPVKGDALLNLRYGQKLMVSRLVDGQLKLFPAYYQWPDSKDGSFQIEYLLGVNRKERQIVRTDMPGLEVYAELIPTLDGAGPTQAQVDTKGARSAGWLPFTECRHLEKNARLIVTRPDGEEVPASYGGQATESFGEPNAIWVNARTGDIHSGINMPVDSKTGQSAYVISLNTHSVRRAPAEMPGPG